MAQSQPQIEVFPPSAREDMAVLVHDLGNHLQIAMSAVRVMAQRANVLSSDELAAVMLHAAESLERAGALIRLSSPMTDAVAEEAVSIGAAITQMGPLLRYVCGSDVRIRLQVGPLPDVRCNRAAFQSAVLNLALNARDAMPQGGTLTISALLADGPEAPEVEVIVTDTGSGMSPEIAVEAFAPHFSTKPPGTGHGLGLPGVKAFVERSDGRVFIESRQGAGTSVVLRLPASTPVGAL
jgi:signal transduction histidine kinase